MRKLIIAALIAALITPICMAGELPDAPSTNSPIQVQAHKFAASQKNAAVLLKDGTKLSGTVLKANETDFLLSENKTGQSRTLAYQDVKQIKRKGMHPAAKVAIVAGAAILGTAILIASQMD